MGDAKQFAKELVFFADSVVPRDIKRLQRAIVLFAQGSVIKKTPVDTGRARSNWQVTINTPAEGYSDRGAFTVVPGMDRFQVGDTLWLVNNVPYILVLENGLFKPKNPGPSKAKGKRGRKIPGRTGKILVKDGYSVQAPKGMLKVTIEELRVHFGNR